ncbi:hypothetical protein Tco_1080242 [Tanacetum coccineum]|uniref:Uncharacterized protein n=1 Tax=Tanacetum coccineum TaxID=301880 RepID=A0ABQ5HU50_9ASTR
MGGSLFRVEKEINYGKEVVIEDGNRVEGPMMIDLIRLRSSLNTSNRSRVESYLAEEKVVMVEDCGFDSEVQGWPFGIFVSSHERFR